MNLEIWLGIGLLVAVAIGVAIRFRGARGDRRSGSRSALAPVPEGWLDLGALPVPYAGRRPLERMLQAFLDVTPSPFASAVRTARTRLVLDGGDGGRGVVLLTPWREPGASVARCEVAAGACAWTASNLALALGQLGPVLLVTVRPGPTLLDAGAGEAHGDATGGGVGPRYWRPGMLDLLALAEGEAIDAELLAHWRGQFEWVLIDASGADDVHALVASLPAGAIHLRVVDAQARMLIADARGPGTPGARPAVLMVDGG